MKKNRGRETSNSRQCDDKQRVQGHKPRYVQDRKSGEARETDKGRNDPSWYIPNATYAQYIGGLNWNEQLGLPVDLNNPWIKPLLATQGKFKVPGVCAFRVIPQFGYCLDGRSPLNVAAQKLYTEVRTKISGSRNYDSPDLMCYCLAVADVYSYITFLQRAIGIVNMYEQVNRYTPDALLRAMKIDPEELRRDLANFQVRVNALIDKVSTFKVPNVFPLYNRRAFMYQNVYKESESLRDQMYIFTPQGFYRFGLDDAGATALRYEAFQATVGVEEQEFTPDDLINYGEQLFSSMWFNEDAGTMSGDIARAFEGNLIELAYIPQGYTIEPIWNIGVLEQMKNATVIPNFQAANLFQNATKEYLTINPTAGVTMDMSTTNWQTNASNVIQAEMLNEDKLLTTTTINVTPDLVIESTRLMAAVRDLTVVNEGNTKTITVYLSLGSEAIISVDFYTFAVNGTTPDQLIIDELHYSTALPDSSADQNLLQFRAIARMSNFRFKPAQHLIPCKQGSAGGTSYQISDGLFYFNLDNYTVVPQRSLMNMHDVALLSMLNVPRK